MKRWSIQLIAFLTTNLNLKGFLTGKLYKGPIKYICAPGLHCYSCPGSIGSCPIGALQSVIGSGKYKISFYIMGLLIAIGTLLGRVVCGWLCPFGWLQELIHKLPSIKFKLPKALKLVKYVLLIYFVLLIPTLFTNAAGMGEPGFCKYICPSGTLFGALPLLLKNPSLRQSLGLLFSWKVLMLIGILTASVFYYRFFCKTMCPLGIIYGLFNKVSVIGYQIDLDQCNHCKACSHVCKMDVKPNQSPNSMDCIRCGDCLKVCPSKALSRKKVLK